MVGRIANLTRQRGRAKGDQPARPRLLDTGQCNEAYGAMQVAIALADVFERGVADVPLTLLQRGVKKFALVRLRLHSSHRLCSRLYRNAMIYSSPSRSPRAEFFQLEMAGRSVSTRQTFPQRVARRTASKSTNMRVKLPS